MRTEAFHEWLPHADALTVAQRLRAIEILRQECKLPDALAGIRTTEPACPRCHHQPAGGGAMPMACRAIAAACTRTLPSAGATACSPFRRTSSHRACTASWKRTKPISWNPTRGSSTCRARPVSAVEWSRNEACPVDLQPQRRPSSERARSTGRTTHR
jgi:hypothetical protein